MDKARPAKASGQLKLPKLLGHRLSAARLNQLESGVAQLEVGVAAFFPMAAFQIHSTQAR